MYLLDMLLKIQGVTVYDIDIDDTIMQFIIVVGFVLAHLWFCK